MITFTEAPATLPPGRRIYAIGDVHGLADRLQTLHDAIRDDLRERPVAAPLLIHLGDYVDRGPDSAGVIALLADGPPIADVETINLIGNHENTMIEALAGDAASATDWVFNGGEPALASYGVAPGTPRDQWAAAVPDAHMAFLRGLAVSHREGGYMFVHGGIRPGVALDEQLRDEMIRMRHPFLNSEADHGAVIVHGHTPVKQPIVRPNRIGIDTGAVLFPGSKLTCLVLEDDRMGFLFA
jgi:serine/threonine protein phosphatase 1